MDSPKSGWEKRPSHSEGDVGAKVSVQVAAGKLVERHRKKIPRGVMAWEAFMMRPWGLAGLNVEKDRHEKL